MIRGEDYVLYPSLEAASNGELVVQFAVPRGARSFVLTVSAHAEREIELFALEGPQAALFDALADPPLGSLARATTQNLERTLPLSVLYPNSSDAPLERGTHRARIWLEDVEADRDASVQVDIVFGRPLDEEQERALGIQLWVAQGASLEAADVVEDARLVEALAFMRAIFKEAGIAVGDVALNDLGDVDSDLSQVDGPDALARIVGALAAFPGAGVHVVLVEHIDAEGRSVLGKTTGVPVPPPHAELDRRGAVVIAIDALPSGADRIGEMLAHEVGHALGLKHTSEADGMHHDALADTLECPAERASFETDTGAVVLSAEDCVGYGADNVMFYTPPRTDQPQRTLSADQALVLTLNPSVL